MIVVRAALVGTKEAQPQSCRTPFEEAMSLSSVHDGKLYSGSYISHLHVAPARLRY